MTYATVVPDISTRALDKPFSYRVPHELEGRVACGSTVLVRFGGRPCVAYVIACPDELPEGLDPRKVLAVQQVLAEPVFDEGAASLAQWIAAEYACNLPDALRLLLPPGRMARVQRDETGAWRLERSDVGEVDDRWVRLTEQGASFTPRANASRQKALLAALAEGPQRMAELRAVMGDPSHALRSLEKAGAVETVSLRVVRGLEQTSLSSARAVRPVALTPEQTQALAAVDAACEAAAGDVVLVDGVTGSGKTEVYLQAIEHALARGKGAVVLVPEISLTAQTVGRFRARFPGKVAVLHSRLSQGERRDQWEMARRGEARVVVGARSALFAPVRDLGLVVIDEEHETSYKQDSAPRYHARETAAELCRIRRCALVLGSATPSLESMGRCRAGTWRGSTWKHVRMLHRASGSALPEVQVVDMAAQFRGGGRSVFSKPLSEALREVAQRREKAVLLLNRRGFASFLMCRACGCVPECPHCSTSLTYHERTHALVCHTCGRNWPARGWPDPSACCPNCSSRYMGAYGVGTQRVEDELGLLLRSVGVQDVEIVRMDADTTRTKGAHQRLLERFDAAQSAVLVGTQMIAKGLDFPEVTLVGVVNADTTLKLPDFRAAERTYDLLEQVAGRSGRGVGKGRVIVQTYWASHPAIAAVAAHDRERYVEEELAEREAAGYPPFGRLCNVVVWGRDGSWVTQVCAEVADRVRQRTDKLAGWEVLGPSDCLRVRVKDRVRRHIVVKAPATSDPGPLLYACVQELGGLSGVSIAVDVDAYDLM